ncbi:hypothetical protein Pelo_4470 [Pelomyxa schiedti]|nr:hypothetical protein Pelo_4470 [Pelomyxa schiedti]
MGNHESSTTTGGAARPPVRITEKQVQKLELIWASIVGHPPKTANLAQFRELIAEAARVVPEVPAFRDPEFAEQLFEILDVDHSNSICHNELFGGLGVLVQGGMTHKAALVFKAADLNGDGFLSKAELTHTLERSLYHSKILIALQTARATGVTVDAQYRRDTAAKARAELPTYSANIQTAVEHAFEQADVNRDGQLSLEEWCKFCLVVPAIRSLFLFAIGEKLLPELTDPNEPAHWETMFQSPLPSEHDILEATKAATAAATTTKSKGH